MVSEVVMLSAWLGASLLFAAVVAPALFEVLPSRSVAGVVVGRVLPVLFAAGILVGSWVAISAGIGPRAGGWATGRLIGGIVMAATCAASQFLIGGRIVRLREAIGPSLDALAADDPRRVAFGKLHALSVAGLGAGVIAALVALALAAGVLRGRSGA